MNGAVALSLTDIPTSSAWQEGPGHRLWLVLAFCVEGVVAPYVLIMDAEFSFLFFFCISCVIPWALGAWTRVHLKPDCSMAARELGLGSVPGVIGDTGLSATVVDGVLRVGPVPDSLRVHAVGSGRFQAPTGTATGPIDASTGDAAFDALYRVAAGEGPRHLLSAEVRAAMVGVGLPIRIRRGWVEVAAHPATVLLQARLHSLIGVADALTHEAQSGSLESSVLRDSCGGARAVAFRQMCALGTLTRAAAKAGLEDADERVRVLAAAEVSDADQLVHFVLHGTGDVPETAIMALATIDPAILARLAQRVTADQLQLIERQLRDDVHHPLALRELLVGAASPEALVAALELALAYPDPILEDLVLPLLSHRRAGVRCFAATALGRLGSEAALPALRVASIAGPLRSGSMARIVARSGHQPAAVHEAVSISAPDAARGGLSVAAGLRPGVRAG
jgi:hypothetical protein